jgi:hypothetical protein
LDGITEVISRLREFPHACSLARESVEFGMPMRQCVYKSHRIIFDVVENTVRIHRIVYAARRNMKSGELDRFTPKP